jgi:hypothetical protein
VAIVIGVIVSVAAGAFTAGYIAGSAMVYRTAERLVASLKDDEDTS